MKKMRSLIAMLGLVLFSCQSGTQNEDANAADASAAESEMDLSRFKELAVDPCNFLTEDMVTSRFAVQSEALELKEYGSGKEKISPYSYCTYSWKKPNHDEIMQRTQEKIMEAMKAGNTKSSMNVAMGIEKAMFEVGVTNIKVFEDEAEAMEVFELYHKVPEKKDVAQLEQSIDEQENDFTDQEKQLEKDMVGGIADHLKFDKVEGIGTMAYWDYMSGTLDVLYGKAQIGLQVHVSENHEENVAAAKELAESIANRF